jgi:hypothetical protein
MAPEAVAAKAAATTRRRTASLWEGRFKKSVSKGSVFSWTSLRKASVGAFTEPSFQSRRQPCAASNPEVRVLLAALRAV